ncbi:TorD/DmsD family molecular chaperone [Marinobacterium jannaschii]|uniref:TorD/DmsD family molecular chaperone n=1 Tax=Marinobacterium jannaschii TaxID=64970 RepID=UPI0004809C97|nr:molecular chaperone TorD family protein [Marinobacterium jannaschii]
MTMTAIETTAAISEQDALRADIFALLASLLRRAPDAALLDWLATLEPEEEDNPMSRAWSALALSASHSQPPQIGDEYQQLFIGIGRGELMPFGCWYLTGSLMEKPLATLRQDLASLGYERQPDIKEPEDHIAAQCEVMSMMISSGFSARQQMQFWKRHLSPWALRFFRDLQNADNALFYSTVALLGTAFYEQEENHYLRLAPTAPAESTLQF